MKKNTRMASMKIVSKLLFALYLLLVIYFMFLADSFHRTGLGTYRYNLVPLQEIERFPAMWRVNGPIIAIVNLFGNVVVFMPLGFFVPFHGRRFRKWYVVTGFVFLFSLFIETTQLVFKIGVFDVDDLLLNTLGGILGYIFYYILFKIYVSYLKKKRRKETGND